MLPNPLTLHWQTEADTTDAGAALGPSLCPGDIILLNGDVGTGKTHFTRALVQSILVTPEDVPSPTFTLVQVYDTVQGPLWHTDLYRVTSTQEIDELGLVDAFDEAICLVEWPDRLGPLAPPQALHIRLEVSGQGRTATLHWTDPRWPDRLQTLVTHA